MMNRVVLFGPSVLLVGCVTTPTNLDATKSTSFVPSEILANRGMYEGQIIRVRGYLSIEPDSICLIDPDHSGDADPPARSMFSVLGLERLQPGYEKFQGKVIVISARFKSKVIQENQFLLNGCGRSGIQIESNQTPVVLK